MSTSLPNASGVRNSPRNVSLALRVRRATLGARWFKPLVFVLALVPLAILVWRAVTVQLGANPQQTLVWSTGLWTLRFLLFTLAVTPLRQLTGWAELARFRRMLGLFTFFYGVLHFTCYVGLMNNFDAQLILEDVVKHPFVLAGFTALLMMVPLAATSTNGMVKRLGAKHWRELHRLVYVVAVVAVFHFWWFKLAKNNTAEPKLYAAMFGALLLWRLIRTGRDRLGARRRQQATVA